MTLRDPAAWMWSDALALLERADRLQRQFCQLGRHGHAGPLWEPPADVFETEQQLLVFVALPGVCAAQLAVAVDGASVMVRGQRPMPELGHDTRIRRIEIPFGRFERRIDLPACPLKLVRHTLEDGCLILILDKITGEVP
jgi:HSP20 family protein